MFVYGMVYRTNRRFGPLLPLPAVNVRTFQAVLQILTKAYIVGEDRCPTLKVSEKTPKWYFGISYLQKPSLLYKFQHLPKMFPTTKVHVRYRWPTACIARIVSVPLQQHELPWNALMEIHELRSGIQPEETSPMAKLRKPLNGLGKTKNEL